MSARDVIARYDDNLADGYGHIDAILSALTAAGYRIVPPGGLDAETVTVPARDGVEAQRGLNDVFPGDPYPVADQLKRGLDNLRARASRGGVTSAEVFTLTDPLMDILARATRADTLAALRSLIEEPTNDAR